MALLVEHRQAAYPRPDAKPVRGDRISHEQHARHEGRGRHRNEEQPQQPLAPEVEIVHGPDKNGESGDQDHEAVDRNAADVQIHEIVEFVGPEIGRDAMPVYPGRARRADAAQECGPSSRRIGQMLGKCAKQSEHEWACRKGQWCIAPTRFRPSRADRRVFVQFEQALERLNIPGGLARIVNNQVSAAMDPFQDRRSHRRREMRKIVARDGEKIESAEINPGIRQAVRWDHFRKYGRVRRRAEAIRVGRAAGRGDVSRAIHRPGRDHEHGRRQLDAKRRRAADDTRVG